MKYDLVVIGGGPGGEKAAVCAAFFGKKVALVEKAEVGPGGAAVHTGTLPSKTLRETALYITGFKRRELYSGIDFGIAEEKRSAKALMCRLPQVRAIQAEQIRDNLDRHGVELIAGYGQLEDAHRVRVGERILDTEHVLIATGSSPRQPADFDFDDPEVFDSDSILELDRLPESLAIIGGGVIGSEYACVFSTLGVEVEIVEKRDRLLGFLDHDISDALMESMKAEGIALHLSNGVKSIVRQGEDLTLTLASGDTRTVDKAMVSAGRTGNTSNMGLQEVGIELNKRRQIVVDTTYKTAIDTIYAVGDVIGRPALASSAMEQGRIAVAAMFDLDMPGRDFRYLPAGIYTIPETCSCGKTQEQLEADGVPFVAGRTYMRHNARGQLIGDTDGFMKLLFHAETKKLLGVHIIAEWATELIHIGQAVMRLDAGIDYFIESIMTYPSLSVAYKYAAYDALSSMTSDGRPPPPLD